jgi:hypothetical protein
MRAEKTLRQYPAKHPQVGYVEIQPPAFVRNMTTAGKVLTRLDYRRSHAYICKQLAVLP